MHTKIALGLLSTMTALTLYSQTSFASCKQGFCMHGRDEGDIHNVEFTSSYNDVDHFNIGSPDLMDGNFGGDANQLEIGKNVRTFRLQIKGARPYTLRYAIQACSRNFVGQSDCSAWVNFTHTAQ